MVHQFEVLKIVCVSLAHALSAVRHSSEENFGFEIGCHEHLEVISLNVTDGLICTEKALLLNLDNEFLQAFDGSCIVGLCAILVLIVANDDPF